MGQCSKKLSHPARTGYKFLRSDANRAHSLAGRAEEALQAPLVLWQCSGSAFMSQASLSLPLSVHSHCHCPKLGYNNLSLEFHLPQSSHLCPCLSSAPPSLLLSETKQIVLIDKADYVPPTLSPSITSSCLRIKTIIF